MYLYSILTACVFDTFCCSFGIWYDYLSYGFLGWSVVSCDDGLVVVVCDAIVVSACNVVVGAVVITCILPVAVNNFILYPFNGPMWILAIGQSTLKDKELSARGVTRVSRNALDSLLL